MTSIDIRTRVLVADADPRARELACTLLAQEGSAACVGEAGDGLEALDGFRTLHPDVALIELSLPRVPGLEVLRQLRQSRTKARVVVLTAYEEPPYLHAALEAGALGYVLKRTAARTLLPAIQAALHGHRYVSPPLQPFLSRHTGSASSSLRSVRTYPQA
jgi:DNA-binding NarL/FixJ family response regulator